MAAGSYVAISTGMLLSGHISVRAKKIVEEADVVFSLMPHPLAEKWLNKISKEHISLQPYYAEGKHRKTSYEEMVERIIAEVRKGKSVCGAFYGHAGVFAWVPHESMRRATEEGYYAYMEPGISADACLYADLGIDPGAYGIQSYEASQFLFFGHTPNISSYLLLWQVALAGESTAKTFHSDANKIDILVNYLLKWYPEEHEVILYEAAFLPIDRVRCETVSVKDLSKCDMKLHTTLVVPPAKELSFNQEIMDLMDLDEESFLARD